MSLTSTLAAHVVSVLPVATAPAASNWFDKFNTLTASATGSAKLVGGLLAVLFVVIGAWKVKGAIAGVVMAFISAALFGWMVNNVGSAQLQKPISDTINGAGVLQPAPVPPDVSTGLRIRI